MITIINAGQPTHTKLPFILIRAMCLRCIISYKTERTHTFWGWPKRAKTNNTCIRSFTTNIAKIANYWNAGAKRHSKAPRHLIMSFLRTNRKCWTKSTSLCITASGMTRTGSRILSVLVYMDPRGREKPPLLRR
jgi:hypothetical protein